MPNQNNQEECKCEKDGFLGAVTSQNCFLHNPKLNNPVDWKEELNTILWENMDLGNVMNPERPMRTSLQKDLVDFIEQTIHQEIAKAVDKRVKDIISILEQELLVKCPCDDGMCEFCERLFSVLKILQPTNNTKE